MALSRDLALSDAELDELLRTEWVMRVSTASADGVINTTPLWFVWHRDRLWAWCRGQKVENLRRDPRCTVLVDRGARFAELNGVMLHAAATVLEDRHSEQAHADLAEVRRIYGAKYAGGHGESADEASPIASSSARGRNWRWVVLEPHDRVSWDNRKLAERPH